MNPAPPELLNWVARALSLFNTVVLLWLGMTVLLNAERRSWGSWVISAGLLFGGLFFVGHTALLGSGLGVLNPQMEFWWHAIWLLFISQPYMWYLVIAWYAGTLQSRKHRIWLAIVTVLGLVALALLALTNPLPSYIEILGKPPVSFPSVGGAPVVLLVYPVYSIICFALAISMLRNPSASDRFMGELGRQRARPWLMGASLVLLAVSLAVGVVAAWFLYGIQTGRITLLSSDTLAMLTWSDLVISGLVAGVTVLVGQAIVSYEVFTGKALPRGGILRDWRYTLILAAVYSTLMAATLNLQIDPVYHLLLATLMMTLFYALLSWRTYVERERSMERLRPFVASQRLYDNLLMPTAQPDIDTGSSFRALCDDVLGTDVAFLTALGPVASLAGRVLSFPEGVGPPGLAGLREDLASPEAICVPLKRAQYGGAVWGVPLWNERGLIGALLLGPRRDGRLYAQEEIEIARAACERLIDTQASAEMSRRLMSLQRERVVQSQVLDQTARRVLHDDVLPDLHAALLAVNREAGSSEGGREAAELLTVIHQRIAKLIREMPASGSYDVARSGPVSALRRAIDAELGGAFDSVKWLIEPEAERMAANIQGMTAEVVFFAAREAVRNAARHGRNGNPDRPLNVTLSVAWDGALRLVVEDDGAGLRGPGYTAEGSGQGLALHSTMMAVIGGTLTIEDIAAGGTRVTMLLPLDPRAGAARP